MRQVVDSRCQILECRASVLQDACLGIRRELGNLRELVRIDRPIIHGAFEGVEEGKHLVQRAIAILGDFGGYQVSELVFPFF